MKKTAVPTGWMQDERLNVGVHSGYWRNTPEANTDLTSHAERSVVELKSFRFTD